MPKMYIRSAEKSASEFYASCLLSYPQIPVLLIAIVTSPGCKFFPVSTDSSEGSASPTQSLCSGFVYTPILGFVCLIWVPAGTSFDAEGDIICESFDASLLLSHWEMVLSNEMIHDFPRKDSGDASTYLHHTLSGPAPPYAASTSAYFIMLYSIRCSRYPHWADGRALRRDFGSRPSQHPLAYKRICAPIRGQGNHHDLCRGAPIKGTSCGRLSLIATPNKWILLIIFPCVHQDGACRFTRFPLVT
jgi:hypothetical protein